MIKKKATLVKGSTKQDWHQSIEILANNIFNQSFISAPPGALYGGVQNTKIPMSIIPAIKIPAGAIKIPAGAITIPAEGMEGVQNTN